ncbi:MAG: hypothetical protein ACT443_06605 [Gemmatimonadota bacterium]
MAERGEKRRVYRQPLRPSGAAVRVHLRGDFYELSFGKGFTLADVEAVKKISGRRWMPERRVWVLPQTAATLDLLAASFGSRLDLDGVPRAGTQTVAGIR